MGAILGFKTLAKLKTFYESGGTIISTTQLPFKSSEMGEDQKVIDLVQEIFGIDKSGFWYFYGIYNHILTCLRSEIDLPHSPFLRLEFGHFRTIKPK